MGSHFGLPKKGIFFFPGGFGEEGLHGTWVHEYLELHACQGWGPAPIYLGRPTVAGTGVKKGGSIHPLPHLISPSSFPQARSYRLLEGFDYTDAG